MVGLKEVNRYTAAETLGREQNSFVFFIGQNKDLFERHTSSSHDLRNEEEGWRNSPTIDEIVTLIISSIGPLNASSPQAIYNDPGSRELRRYSGRVKESVIQRIFGNDEQSNLIKKQTHKASLSPGTNPEQRAKIEELDVSINEFRESFREAKAPLAAEVEKSKTELLFNFKNYLLSDPDSVFAFRDFLSDKKHASSKEAIRPFLASFAQSEDRLGRGGKGILGETVKKWTGEISGKVTSSILDEFAASIKSSNVLEWLRFAAQGEDIANFLKSCPVSTYTKELKTALSSFVLSKYSTARSSIEKDLKGFVRPPASKSLQPIRLESQGKRKRAKRANDKAEVRKEQDDGKGTLEKAEEKIHPIGILTKEIGSSFEIRSLTEEELTARLQKEANSLAASDSRMMEDLKNIFRSLRKDPFGSGTKKLNDRGIAVGHFTLPLRTLNPGKRIGLHFEHPELQKIKIVYVIFKNGDAASVIGIEGIYNHDDYESKFA